MEDTKSLLASKTVLAGIGGILAAIATIFQGFAADPADMSIVSTGIVALLSAVGTVYGRISATAAIE